MQGDGYAMSPIEDKCQQNVDEYREGNDELWGDEYEYEDEEESDEDIFAAYTLNWINSGSEESQSGDEQDGSETHQGTDTVQETVTDLVRAPYGLRTSALAHINLTSKQDQEPQGITDKDDDHVYKHGHQLP